MKIIRIFNLMDGKIGRLEQEISTGLAGLGKLVIYKGIPFEWIMYDLSQIPHLLYYSEINPDTHNCSPDQIEIISLSEDLKVCDCGGKVANTTHAFWCNSKKSDFTSDETY